MSLQCRHTSRIKWAADQLQPFPASKKARELQQLGVNVGSEHWTLHRQPAVTLRKCPTLLGQETRSHSFPPRPQECRKGKHLVWLPDPPFYWPCNELSALSGEMKWKRDSTEQRKSFNSSNWAQPMPGNAVPWWKGSTGPCGCAGLPASTPPCQSLRKRLFWRLLWSHLEEQFSEISLGAVRKASNDGVLLVEAAWPKTFAQRNYFVPFKSLLREKLPQSFMLNATQKFKLHSLPKHKPKLIFKILLTQQRLSLDCAWVNWFCFYFSRIKLICNNPLSPTTEAIPWRVMHGSVTEALFSWSFLSSAATV